MSAVLHFPLIILLISLLNSDYSHHQKRPRINDQMAFNSINLCFPGHFHIHHALILTDIQMGRFEDLIVKTGIKTIPRPQFRPGRPSEAKAEERQLQNK